MARRGAGGSADTQGALDFEAGEDPLGPPDLPDAPSADGRRDGAAPAVEGSLPALPLTEGGIPAPPEAPHPQLEGRNVEPAPEGAPAAPAADRTLLDEETVCRSFGAGTRQLLDRSRWQKDPDPAGLLRSIGEQARQAAERERALREPLRRLLRERLAAVPDAPPHAGLHPVEEADLERVARGYLYNGLTEAVCGDLVMHETVPLSIGQMGVCAVSYDGRMDQWHQRLVRQEVTISLDDALEEAEAVLLMRDRLVRPHPGYPPGGARPHRLQQLSDLARRGFVSYMEREVMLTECADRWRMGYGVPAPLDLLTGMGSMQLVEISLDLLRRFLVGDPRWVFVSRSSAEPGLETLIHALEPFEFAVLLRLHSSLSEQVEHGRYPSYYARKVEDFVDEVGRHLVLGAFRAGALSPPRFFAAHEERVYTAALIVMADALSVEPQGFPALIQLARASCRAALGGPHFEQVVQQAYREAGAPEWFHRGEIR